MPNRLREYKDKWEFGPQVLSLVDYHKHIKLHIRLCQNVNNVVPEHSWSQMTPLDESHPGVVRGGKWLVSGVAEIFGLLAQG